MAWKLFGEGKTRAELSADVVEEMFALFDEYYDGATPETFRRDLSKKDRVILLRETDGGGLQGFSTLALAESVVQGQRIGVLYSGDTIIRRAFWGTPELPRTWLKTVLSLAAAVPYPLYWLLISSGYKTYRTLPVFANEFYPRYDRPTPPDAQAMLDQLATERFGSEYLPARGVVRFATGATPLKDGVADVEAERLRDPHVAFFLDKNPGHVRGDELVCLARFHPDNFTAAARRLAR